MNDWISVEERVPDKGRVIAYGVRYYLRHKRDEYESLIVDYLSWRKAFFTDSGGRFLATHWMPKPKNPREIPLGLDSREKIRMAARELREYGLSYQKIAERLNDKGYRNAAGNPFTHGNVWTLLGSGAAPEEVKP